MKSLLLSFAAAATLLVATNLVTADDTPPPIEEVQAAATQAQTTADQKGDTAWMLVATAFVMVMLPGLAMFYGGLVRRKNVLATMMHSMAALAVVGVFWIAVGYALAFGQSIGGVIGWDSKFVFLNGVKPDDYLPGTNIPIYLHVMYQGMFAIITPALISGAIAERIRFIPYCLFLLLWVTLIYCPLAHCVWAMNWWDLDPTTGEAAKDAGTVAVGLLGKMGALDFAGGTVVHISAGLAGLAAILVLKKRTGYPEHAMHPNSVVLTLLGAGFLWFGWFGFNGGSGLGSTTVGVAAFAATQAAAAAAGLTWMVAEWRHKKKPTAVGLATGVVAGLVAVTPASGFVPMWAGLIIGVVAAGICYAMVALKPVFKYDDSLDAFGVHGVGGFVGAILTGVFCAKAVNSAGADGLVFGGGAGQVVTQTIAAVGSVVFALVVSLALVKLVDLALGFSADAEEETLGLDRTQHGEVGFDSGLIQEVSEAVYKEPRAAAVPPNGDKRFTVVIDGPSPELLTKAWSDLCQVGTAPPSADFKAIYPYLTTVQGNRFRFRGGNPETLRSNLVSLFKGKVPGTVRVRVET